MADDVPLPQIRMPIPAPIRETTARVCGRWVSKFTGGTTSMRGAILSMCAIVVLLTIFGQLLHLAAPRAHDPQTVYPPPPMASPALPPPYVDGMPLLPPNGPAPPHAPPLAPPPEAWWQRRLPLETELEHSRWELLAVILLCVVVPTCAVGHRNYKRWRDGSVRKPYAAHNPVGTSSSTASHRPGTIGVESVGGRRRGPLMAPELPTMDRPL